MKTLPYGASFYRFQYERAAYLKTKGLDNKTVAKHLGISPRGITKLIKVAKEKGWTV